MSSSHRISGRSPRQRVPELVPRLQRAVVLLDDRGEGEHAAWLLLAMIEPELRRPGSIAPEAVAHANAAALLFARDGLLRAATELFLAAGSQHRAATTLRQGKQNALAHRISGLRGRTCLGERIPGLSLLGHQPSAAHRPDFDDGLQRALHSLEQLAPPDAVLRLYDGLGLRTQAAERAVTLGLGADAAPRLLATGRAFEAGRCWAKAGDDLQALEALYQVPKDSQSYRAACVLAVALAVRQDLLRFELDHMVGPFCTSRAQSSAEIDAMRALAGLYRRHGRLHSAREILESLYASEPGLRALRDDLAELEGALELDACGPSSDPGTERLVGPDSLLEDLELPSLPDLPEIPELPPLAPDTGSRPRRPVPLGATQQVGSGAGIPALGATLSPLSVGPEQGDGADGHSQPTVAFELEDTAEPEASPVQVGPGALVAGRYRVEELLGQGGMGAVYRAMDGELSEQVALKILIGEARSQSNLARFRQELRLARKLTHNNIVRVHDLGVHGGQRFITMELLQGAELRDHMDADELPRGERIDLICQAAAGLQAAHDMGVVHRDVKPENLFVTWERVLKVMDFGIARTIMAQGMTMDGAMGGTATYMAPEQASGFSSVDARADQYALGVVAYELLTGRPPFEHEALMPLLHMHATEPPPSMRTRDASISAPVDEVVLRSLAKDPGDRFEDCTDFGRALREAWETPYHVLGR